MPVVNGSTHRRYNAESVARQQTKKQKTFPPEDRDEFTSFRVLAQKASGKKMHPYEMVNHVEQQGILGNRFRILTTLGVGGMGATFVAEDMETKQWVTVKVSCADFAAPEMEALAKLPEEQPSEYASRLYHVGTVPTPETTLIYFATRFLEGIPLNELLKNHGPLPPEQALKYALDILIDLEVAHEAGIVHRDLRPQNILANIRMSKKKEIIEFGQTRVIDFGLSSPFEVKKGTVAGSPGYMSPEQARGTSPDQRGDFYSIGILLFEMLTNQELFPGKTNKGVLRKQAFAKGKVVLPASPNYNEKTRVKLETLLNKFLAYEPENRPENPQEAKTLLRKALKAVPKEPQPSFEQEIAALAAEAHQDAGVEIVTVKPTERLSSLAADLDSFELGLARLADSIEIEPAAPPSA